MSDYFLEEAQQVSEKTDDQLSIENIANYNAIKENTSSNNKKISEETISLSITEKLKHGVDYASSILNSANEWLKENDPLKGYALPPLTFAVAEAGINSGWKYVRDAIEKDSRDRFKEGRERMDRAIDKAFGGYEKADKGEYVRGDSYDRSDRGRGGSDRSHTAYDAWREVRDEIEKATYDRIGEARDRMIENMDSVRLDRYIALYSSENSHNEFGDSKDNLRDAINEASDEKFKEARSKMIAAFKEKFGNENKAWHAEGYNKYTKSFLRRGIDNIILGDDRLIGANHLRWTNDIGGFRIDFRRGETNLEHASDQFIKALKDDIDNHYRLNLWDIKNCKSEPDIDKKYYEAKAYAYKVLQDALGDSEKVMKMKAEAERVAKEAERKQQQEAKTEAEKARQDAEIEKERAKSNEGLSIAIEQATEKDRQAINDKLDEAEKEFRQASEKLHRMSNQQDTCSAGSGTCRAQGDTSSFSNEQKTSSALDVIDKELKNLNLLLEDENKVRQTLFEDRFIGALKEGNVQQLGEEANTGSKNPYSNVKPSSVEDIKGKIITALGNKLGNRVLDRIIPVMGMYNLVVEHNKVADDFVKQQKAKELINSLEGIPQADKLPENPGTSIDNRQTSPNIEINTGANKQEPLPGFTPAKTTDGLKGSTIPDQSLEDYTLLKEYPDTVDKVGGRYPINAEYADSKYPVDKLPEDLQKKYPNSVEFDEKGFPNFKPYTKKEVQVEGLTGEHSSDFNEANKVAGYKKTPDSYTWHHHQDRKTMQLVPEDIHDAIRHTGGAATIKHNHKVE
jgi:hypothetical protein